ncbi:MAG: hypothetical protein KTR13_09085 [Saprospiraceae bacterium]|nr:hypothetical protein [Saprospiraceae bacterium]
MNPIIYFFALFTLLACVDGRRKVEPVLLADREAPLGWIYLRVYEDQTFEFESRGLERRGDIYSGKLSIKNDTLFFSYESAIPSAGSIAITDGKYIAYINGEYPERLSIKKNELFLTTDLSP